MKKIILFSIILFVLYWLGTMTVHTMIEKSSNLVKEPAPYEVSEEAIQLFHSFNFVADLHCDALLWGRDLTKKSDFNRTDDQDNITLLNIIQGRPISDWFSLINRTMYQSNNLQDFIDAFGEEEIRAIMGENVRQFLLKNL
jgi:membrane dipeptidase